MTRRAHSRSLTVLSGLVLAVVALLAAPATAGDLAVLIHLEGGPTPEVPVDAATLRQSAHEVLAALTGSVGLVGCDRNLTEELVRRHRVRTGSNLTLAFLADLHDELGAPSLLAVTLLIDAEQLAATTRLVDTATGLDLAAGLSETAVENQDWHRALISVLREAFPDMRAPAEDKPSLLMLPGRGVALDPQAVRAATHCVLDEALKDGRWSLVDPGLINAVAAAAGRNADRLDAVGRAALVRQFRVRWAVVPEVVSYGFTAAAPVLMVPEGGLAASRRAAVTDLVLTVYLLDLNTGLVAGSMSVRAPGQSGPGWFGLVQSLTLFGQLRHGAAELWPEFQRRLEAATS